MNLAVYIHINCPGSARTKISTKDPSISSNLRLCGGIACYGRGHNRASRVLRALKATVAPAGLPAVAPHSLGLAPCLETFTWTKRAETCTC